RATRTVTAINNTERTTNISESVLEKIKEALQNNNQALAAAKIKELLDNTSNTTLNIGITGEAGSGKSSFVNAFRGVDDRDEKAAPVGVVETTAEVKEYPHPNYPNVSLWDLPGIGTTKFPADEYLKLVGFEKFDFFIIISETRFRENDVKLAKEIQKMGKKFYFVRSKVDNDLQSEQRYQRDFDPEKTLSLIRENCKRGLLNAGLQAQVFLLSSFELQRYDFHLLYETLEREFPEHQRDVLLVAMSNISLEINGKKKEAFKSKIPYWALVSSVGALVPVPGLSVAVDLSLIAGLVQQYKTGFGLGRPSLQRLADTTGVQLTDLTSVIRSPLGLNIIDAELIVKALSELASVAGLMAAEEGLRFIPIFGTMIAGTLSYAATYNALSDFLKMLTEDAQNVFEKAL
uniref:IRG-type G domain-containing protein n=1 Tax=Tetraodon nigroviridis TaxID=99883 RepID=H3C7G8_TETNG